MRFRIGNEMRENKYWKEEKKRIYMLCGRERENHGSTCGRDIENGKKEGRGVGRKNIGGSWEEMGRGKSD